MYARVVVDVANHNTNDLYTYIVPEIYKDLIYPGSRVYVEFGFRNVLAYVINLVDEAEYTGSLKEIIEVVDIDQGLTREQLDLSLKIANDTKALYTSCLALMYPALMKSKIRKVINVLNFESLDAELALLFNFKKKVNLTKKILEKSQKLKKEIENGNIEIVSEIRKYGSRQTVKYYKLREYREVASKKRQKVLDFVLEFPLSSKEDIKASCDVSDFIIDRLERDRMLEFEEKVPLEAIDQKRQVKTIYFDFDSNSIVEKFDKLKGKPYLLASNDEDFKLGFYLDAAVKMYNNGKSSLIICPSTLSSLMLYNYFKKNTVGYQVLYFSSKIENSEFFRNYKRLETGKAAIIIGLSQSIFLPVNDLGLIMMLDYDHSNYQIDEYPNYSVVEVLKYRATYNAAKLLLSSKVLGIDGYYNYYTARYFLLKKMNLREDNVRLINLRDELGDLLISRSLKEGLTKNKNEKKISMLILNNTSYSSHVLCKDCSTQLKCPKCKIGMYYRQDKDLYRCPYCNHQEKIATCSNCSSTSFSLYGFGLEKLSERLKELYPDARIIQVDSKSFKSNEDYENLLLAIEENEVDFIIGTYQLIDLVSDNISLVSIVNLESLLHINDYRSSEIVYNTVFKLINSFSAAIYIQSFSPTNKLLLSAIKGDFDTFYKEEIESRESLNYPPFVELSKLSIIGDYKDIYYYANSFKKTLRRVITADALGPVYDSKIKGVKLLIKHNEFDKLSVLIDEVNTKFSEKKLTVNFERYPKYL